jgi:cation:H+ antiporter
MLLTLAFIVACSLVIYGGIQLTKIGDQFEDVGISAGFVGTVLLAFTTSLPEFVATFSSIYGLDAPQLALGNIFGSNTFNLAILALMDLFLVKEIIYHRVNHFVIKSLAVGQMMTLLALVGIFLTSGSYILKLQTASTPILCLSIFSLLILLVYIITFGFITTVDGTNQGCEDDSIPPGEAQGADSSPRPSKQNLALKFFGFALLVVVSGIWLTGICDQIADISGLGKTFIGAILLAFATSLPEVTVCATAVKLGNYTLVFGNVLGSNIFNLFILGIADLLTPKLELFGVADAQLNYITGFGSMLMYSIILLAIYYQGSRKLMKSFSWGLLGLYISTYYILFMQRNG